MTLSYFPSRKEFYLHASLISPVKKTHLEAGEENPNPQRNPQWRKG
jgi:hypothetical protein